jgi:hypothetical protein
MEFMSNLSLYQLSTQYLEALDFLTDPENEIDAETAENTIESLDGTLDDKLLNVAKFIASIENQSAGIAEAEKRQRARRQSLDKKAEWLRDYVKSAMTSTGHTKLTDSYISLALAKLPPSVQIEDESLIPPEFMRTKTEVTPDKTLIKNSGGCPGARIESSGYRVSIK